MGLFSLSIVASVTVFSLENLARFIASRRVLKGEGGSVSVTMYSRLLHLSLVVYGVVSFHTTLISS